MIYLTDERELLVTGFRFVRYGIIKMITFSRKFKSVIKHKPIIYFAAIGNIIIHNKIADR